MANTIRIKRSTGSSAPSSLANAELAYAEGTNILYYGTGTGGAGGSATSIEAVGGDGAFFDKTTSQTANYVLAAPNGSAGAATYRALVAADIPSIVHTKVSDFDTGVQANRVDQLASATNPVSGVTPTADAHFAIKSYVDGVAQGLDVKDSCKVATTANGTLASAFANGETVDGITLATNDRILIKNQSSADENGIYKINASGAPTRADDMAASSNAAGAFTFVEQGTTNADIGFVCTSNTGSAVVGTNDLAFSTFSSSGNVTAGNGLDKSGNELSLDIKSGSGLVITSTELDLDADLTALAGCQTGAATALALLTSTEVATLDGITATTSELNILSGVTATATELNYVDGVTSAIQTQLDAKLTSSSTIDGGTF